MALINCPECGKEISDQAVSCPNCGCPVKSESPSLRTSENSTNNLHGVPPVPPSPAPCPPPVPRPQQQPGAKRKESVLGIIGLILSVFFCLPIFPVVGFILCIIAIRNKKHSSVCATIGLIISIFSIILGVLAPQYMKYVDEANHDSSIESSTNVSNEAIATSKPAESPVADEGMNREEFIASCEEIPYKTLARYPDENAGKHITLTVKITQILQGGLFDNTVYYRVYTDNDGYGFYFSDEYLMYDSRIDDDTKLLEDDIIRVYGEFIGTESITRALTGTAEDIPAFKAYYIDILDEDFTDDTGEYATIDKFNQIEKGMTYEEIVEIMGTEGELISSMDIMDITNTIYNWHGKDGISSVTVSFENNVVSSKIQVGLD